MKIIGCDYHPGFQQIALVDTDSGELQERRLQHREEAETFYRDLAGQATLRQPGINGRESANPLSALASAYGRHC